MNNATELTPEAGPPRRRSRLWKAAAWVAVSLFALLVVAGIALTLVLQSARFHNYLLQTVEKRASDTLGTQVQLQNFAAHLSNLSLDLYGLTVHGANPYPNPPLRCRPPGGEGVYRRARRNQHTGDQEQRLQQQ